MLKKNIISAFCLLQAQALWNFYTCQKIWTGFTIHTLNPPKQKQNALKTKIPTFVLKMRHFLPLKNHQFHYSSQCGVVNFLQYHTSVVRCCKKVTTQHWNLHMHVIKQYFCLNQLNFLLKVSSKLHNKIVFSKKQNCF